LSFHLSLQLIGAALRVDRDFYSNIWRRNCDAAVQRSPGFEALDEMRRLVIGDAREAEGQPY
jgi:hypothetical protein